MAKFVVSDAVVFKYNMELTGFDKDYDNHSGQRGVVIKEFPDKHRYLVEFEDGVQIPISEDSLVKYKPEE